MFLALALACEVHAAPVTLTLEGWTSEAKHGYTRLTRPDHPAVALTHGPMWQLELDKIPQEELLSNPWLAGVLNTPEMEGARWRLEQHPRHGAVMRGDITREDLKVRLELAFGAMADGFFLLTVADGLQGEPLGPTLELALDKLVITSPPLPEDQLPYGRYEVGKYYSMALPPGIRALTPKERKALGVITGVEVFIRPSAPSPELESLCTTVPKNPFEVLDPERAPGSVALWQASVRASMRTAGSPLIFDEDGGAMQLVELGDREGWMWYTSGEVNGQKKAVDVFYTTWDHTGLLCMASANERETVNLFSAAFPTIRITDGEKHPPLRSWQGAYLRSWPLPGQPPALWLVFLVGGVLCSAGVAVTRDRWGL